jgi:hypothetical protein
MVNNQQLNNPREQHAVRQPYDGDQDGRVIAVLQERGYYRFVLINSYDWQERRYKQIKAIQYDNFGTLPMQLCTDASNDFLAYCAANSF